MARCTSSNQPLSRTREVVQVALLGCLKCGPGRLEVQEGKLKELVHKYSEFIHFPIYILTEKEVDVPVEEEEQEEQEQEQADQGGFLCPRGARVQCK